MLRSLPNFDNCRDRAGPAIELASNTVAYLNASALVRICSSYRPNLLITNTPMLSAT